MVLILCFHLMQDLAMIYIDQPFESSNEVKTIELNDHIANLQGKTAIVSGWGKTENEHHPRILSATPLVITNDRLKDGKAIIEMLHTDGSGVCMGDSGGNYLKYLPKI